MYKYYLENEYVGGDPKFWSKTWSTAGLPNKNSGRSLLYSPEYKEIRRRLSPPAKILEAGCGHGQWVLRLAQKGYEITGLDFSEPTIEALKKQFPEHSWMIGDVRKTDFPDNTWDGVLSWGVVEHFENGCDDILQDKFRIIRPGGYLFISVPYINKDLLEEWKDPNGTNYAQLNPARAKFFQYYMTRDEITAIVKRAGFEVEDLVPINRYYFKNASKNPIIKKAGILGNVIASPLIDGNRYASLIMCVARKPAAKR